MKTKMFAMILMYVLTMVLFNQCKKEKEEENIPEDTILPSAFMVSIPESISKGKLQTRGIEGDTASGNDIYAHLTTFIAVGEASAMLVQGIIFAIAVNHINQPMSFTYISNDDHRSKNCVVIENSAFNNQNWEFQLTITDALSESSADGGKAMQVFWNRSPVKGIAILKPYNIDRIKNANNPDVMYRVDYSEDGTNGYEKQMEVYITGLPLASPLEDPYSMRTLKMFAGKKGDIVDVYGNSEHPNAKLFTTKTGFDWAFIAAGKDIPAVGIAEVGLPPNTLNESNKDTLLKKYSIKNVFTDQIYETWPTVSQSELDAFLYNTQAPGYFDNNGFIQGGTAPSILYNDIEARLPALTPYNPYLIHTMTISFK